MKIRFSMLLLLCLLMLSSMCANTLYAQEFISANPRYAAVVLPEFSPKGILVVFDESAGTGKGYDTVYVDANLDGTISKDERFSDESGNAKVAGGAIHFIDPVVIEPVDKKPVSYEIAFFMSKFKAIDGFDINVYRDIQYEGKRWSIEYTGSIKPSKIAAKPFIYKPVRVPQAVVKSSTTKKVTGIAISLTSGGVDISSSTATANMVLRNSAGKTVKKAQGSLDKFGFG